MSEKGSMIAAIIVLCLAAVTVALAVFFSVFFIIRLVRTNRVKKCSSRYQILIEANEKFKRSYAPIKPEYSLFVFLNSKAQLDAASAEKVIELSIHQDQQFYSGLYNAISGNRSNYALYEKMLQSLPSELSEDDLKLNKIPIASGHRIEQRLIKKNTLPAPTMDTSIQVGAEYISPQGRNHYVKKFVIPIDGIRSRMQRIQMIPYQQRVADFERSLMTPKMRYEVLKRDNFRCVICGRTAAEGAKLHVDHIIPVSKGGRTVMNNLRTLCETCNLGKGASYDPYGPN